MLQRHHRLQSFRDDRHRADQQDFQRQDLRQGQPKQLRGRRGGRDRVPDRHGLQRHRVQRQAEGARNVHKLSRHDMKKIKLRMRQLTRDLKINFS